MRHGNTLVWSCFCALCLLSQAATAQAFSIHQADTRLANDVYLLNAQAKLNLSKESLEALENGVPLTISLETEVLRQRKLLWPKRIARINTRYQLKFHALSQQYLLKNLSTGVTTGFRLLVDALETLGNLQDFPLIDRTLLKASQHYFGRLRLRLDIAALPAPLRLVAYLSPTWRMKSAWYQWPLQLP